MTDKPKMRIQSITMDGSRVTDIEVVPVDAITGTQRCEPPEHLRGVDGWHWVQRKECTKPEVRAWDSRAQIWLIDDGETALWWTTYHSPAAPPAVVRGLVEALAPFANAGSIFALTDNDLGTARAALARAKDAGL